MKGFYNRKKVFCTLLSLLMVLCMAAAAAEDAELLTGLQYNGTERPGCRWSGKNVLVIGDSQTANSLWQTRLALDLGMNVYIHAMAGMTFEEIVQGRDYERPGLSMEEVEGMDLIVLYLGYNDVALPVGEYGDCYSPISGSGATVAGMLQYDIDRITMFLQSVENQTCRLLIVTPHCYGKQPSSAEDGYAAEAMADMMVEVARKNCLPVCDLWHNSGINRTNWDVFAICEEFDLAYTMVELDEEGNEIGEDLLVYEPGKAYWQLGDEGMVLTEYAGAAPYPYYGDQLHCSAAGYDRIGECIEGAIIASWGF